jgi:hypothetical protein
MFTRVLVATGATAVIGAVLYFASIGYKRLFSVWPWDGFNSRQRA